MKMWQYSLSVIAVHPEQFSVSETALNALGTEGWEAVAVVPMTGVTGIGKAVVLCRREVRKRRANAAARAA